MTVMLNCSFDYLYLTECGANDSPVRISCLAELKRGQTKYNFSLLFYNVLALCTPIYYQVCARKALSYSLYSCIMRLVSSSLLRRLSCRRSSAAIRFCSIRLSYHTATRKTIKTQLLGMHA
jgi:hypothetical protein